MEHLFPLTSIRSATVQKGTVKEDECFWPRRKGPPCILLDLVPDIVGLKAGPVDVPFSDLG